MNSRSFAMALLNRHAALLVILCTFRMHAVSSAFFCENGAWLRQCWYRQTFRSFSLSFFSQYSTVLSFVIAKVVSRNVASLASSNDRGGQYISAIRGRRDTGGGQRSGRLAT